MHAYQHVKGYTHNITYVEYLSNWKIFKEYKLLTFADFRSQTYKC